MERWGDSMFGERVLIPTVFALRALVITMDTFLILVLVEIQIQKVATCSNAGL